MVVSLQENEREATANSMQFYCSTYCRFNGVCNKQRTPKLASTVRALEMLVTEKDYSFDFNVMPAKATQLKYIAKRTRAEIQNERYESSVTAK